MFSWGHLKTDCFLNVRSSARKKRRKKKKRKQKTEFRLKRRHLRNDAIHEIECYVCPSFEILFFLFFFRLFIKIYSFVIIILLSAKDLLSWPIWLDFCLMGTTVGSWVCASTPKTIFENFNLTMNNDKSHSFDEFHNEQWTNDEQWHLI